MGGVPRPRRSVDNHPQPARRRARPVTKGPGPGTDSPSPPSRQRMSRASRDGELDDPEESRSVSNTAQAGEPDGTRSAAGLWQHLSIVRDLFRIAEDRLKTCNDVDETLRFAAGLARAFNIMMRPVVAVTAMALVGLVVLATSSVAIAMITRSPWPSVTLTGLLAAAGGTATFVYRSRRHKSN